MEVNYSTLEEWQLDLITEYCKDEMKKLKAICYSVWGKKGIPLSDHDYLYSDAINALSESVVYFDPTKNAQFKTFLTNNIKLSYREWCRNNYYRGKRNNLELDENGKIKRDEKENPTIIPNVSFDALTEDGIDLAEKIPSDFDTFEEACGNDFSGTKVEKYLARLSTVQRKIVTLLSNGYKAGEIRELLHMSNKQYSQDLAAIQAYENVRVLM